MLKLYLIRHGETDWNADGRIQGHSDVELNERGLEQARRLALRIGEEKEFIAIYSSPLIRAYRTAELMGIALGLHVTPDPRLLERSLGQLEGLTMNEIRERFPDVHRAWHQGGPRPHIAGEESRAEFVQRVRTFVRDIRGAHAEGQVIAVTHGGTINMLLMASLDLDIERPLPFWIDNASINIVQWGERGARLRLLNDTCHLNHEGIQPTDTNTRTRPQTDQKITAVEVQ
jgi:broad specificity phosphatase PhoE